MKAVRIAKPGKIEIVEAPRPRLGANDVLIEVRAVGLCGSDRSTFAGKNAMVSFPRIPGHEIGGVVVDAGKSAQLLTGLNCTVSPYQACGKCTACRKGAPHCCQFNRTMGVQRDGAMCELIKVPADKIFPSKSLDFDTLALVEPMTVGFQCVKRSEVSAGESVLVFGVGAVGLGAIAGAAARGASVTAYVRRKEKESIARAMGARKILRPGEPWPKRGYDVVIEATGDPKVIPTTVEAASFVGRISLVGYATSPVTFDNFRLPIQKRLTINCCRNAEPDDFRAVIKYLESGKLPIERLITRKIKPEELQSALEDWIGGESIIRILVDMT